MEWSEDAITQLRALWIEGHSTAEIGRRMGVTKNAVVGKAHRLKLCARPSPIRRERPADARPRSPRAQATLPKAAPAARAEPTSVPAGRPALRAVATAPNGRVSPCCWPIGEPGTRSFRFCDDATLPNKPYCETHAQLAYVRIKDKRESAA